MKLVTKTKKLTYFNVTSEENADTTFSQLVRQAYDKYSLKDLLNITAELQDDHGQKIILYKVQIISKTIYSLKKYKNEREWKPVYGIGGQLPLKEGTNMNPVEELKKVASEAKAIDPELAKQIIASSEELAEIEKKEEDIEEKDFIKESDDDEKEASKKEASYIVPGDKITCVNPIQGIFKGRNYIAGDFVEPGLIAVKEEDGQNVGLFRENRFVKFKYTI